MWRFWLNYVIGALIYFFIISIFKLNIKIDTVVYLKIRINIWYCLKIISKYSEATLQHAPPVIASVSAVVSHVPSLFYMDYDFHDVYMICFTSTDRNGNVGILEWRQVARLIHYFVSNTMYLVKVTGAEWSQFR
jgi:hypothetical protein